MLRADFTRPVPLLVHDATHDPREPRVRQHRSHTRRSFLGLGKLLQGKRGIVKTIYIYIYIIFLIAMILF